MVVRAALIGNRDDTDPGLVGHVLRGHGYSFVEFPREDPSSWTGTDGLDLVVSLGSSWSTYWPEVAAETDAERDLLRAAHGAGVPVLGICFGGQQLASALGGTVQRSQMHEIGWCAVDSLSHKDFPGSEALAGTWFQWHYDRFSLPPGATELAASPVSPQAFALGRTLALQFHPEVTETIVARWSSGGGATELAEAGINREELLERTRALVNHTEPRTAALVEWFLERAAQAHETQR